MRQTPTRLASLLIVAAMEVLAGATPIATGRHGLSLVLDASGRVARVDVAGRALPLRAPAGFAVTDVRTGRTHAPAMRPAGPHAWQGEAGDVRCRLRYSAGERAIRVDLDVEDTTGRGRALVAAFSLPFAAAGWTWWEGLRTSYTIAPGGEYFVRTSKSRFGADGALSIYPLGALCSREAGLCLAVPPDAPRNFVIKWDAERGMTIRFFLGTSPDTPKFPNRASASFILYACDPKWGFRDALQRYYDLFPAYFERRAKKSGAWLCGHRARQYDTPEAIAALGRRPSELFGYRLVFGKLLETLPEDLEAGLVSIPFNIALAKLRYRGPAPCTRQDARRLLDRVGQPGFEGRFQGYWKGPASVRNSALLDPQGLPVVMNLAKQPDDTPADRRIEYLVNVDPDLFADRTPRPDTAGQRCMGAALRAVEVAPRIGGIYFDYLSSLAPYANFRREHWPYADIPLTFLAGGQVVQHNRFCLIGYLRELNARCRDRESPMRGKLVWCNGAKYFQGGVAFMAMLVDVVGFEWPLRWQQADWIQFEFARVVAAQKPVLHTCNAKYDPAVDMERVVAPWYSRMAFYGIPPSVRAVWADAKLLAQHRDLILHCTAAAVALQRAGWQPITLARSSAPDVWVERFGPGADGGVYLSLFNAADAVREVRLTVDPKLCGAQPVFAVMGRQARLDTTASPAGVRTEPIRIPARRMRVVRLRRR